MLRHVLGPESRAAGAGAPGRTNTYVAAHVLLSLFETNPKLPAFVVRFAHKLRLYTQHRETDPDLLLLHVTLLLDVT